MTKKMIFSIVFFVISFIFMIVSFSIKMTDLSLMDDLVFVLTVVMLFLAMTNLLFIGFLWVYEHWIHSFFSIIISIVSIVTFIIVLL